MTLNHIKAPSLSNEKLQEGISIVGHKPSVTLNLAKANTVDDKAISLVATGNLNDHNHPHEIFDGNLKNIAAGMGTDGLKSIGWRYLLLDHEDNTSAIETYHGENGGYVFGGINTGRFVKATIKLIRKLTAGNDSAEYNVSAIRIPDLYVFALWLRASDAKNDIIVPMEPCNSALTVEKQYSTIEFFSTLKPLAENLLKSDK